MQGLTSLYEYSQKIRELGLNVIILAVARPNEKEMELLNGVYIYRVPMKSLKRNFFNTLFFNYKILIKLFNLRKNNIKIMHIYSYLFSFFIKLLYDPFSLRYKWIYDIRSGPIENKKKSSILYYFFKQLLVFESLFFDRILIINEGMKKEIFKNNTNSKITIIPLGIDTSLFCKKRRKYNLLHNYQIDPNNFLLVYVGAVSSKRKLDKMIFGFKDAYSNLKNLKLFIIGEGDDLIRLKQLTAELCLSNNVYFLGYINYNKIPDYLSLIDVALAYVPILPSFNYQPPTKTIEYLSYSLPVIATRTDGNCNFIINNVNGILIDDDDKSVSKAIMTLYKNRKLRQKLIKNSRSSIIQYDWRTIVNEHLLPVYLS
jgi:glycosyltransferase involved in cell wall biosynthesis